MQALYGTVIKKNPDTRKNFIKYPPNFLSVHSAPNVRKRQKQGEAKESIGFAIGIKIAVAPSIKNTLNAFSVFVSLVLVCVLAFSHSCMCVCVTVVDNWHNKEEETAMAATK